MSVSVKPEMRSRLWGTWPLRRASRSFFCEAGSDFSSASSLMMMFSRAASYVHTRVADGWCGRRWMGVRLSAILLLAGVAGCANVPAVPVSTDAGSTNDKFDQLTRMAHDVETSGSRD